MRSDFSVIEWVKHLLRYFTGQFLSSIRGQRVVWAMFNTALRDVARMRGALVHKTSHENALTKSELKELVDRRSDLVQKIATFGAQVPTTSMHWKKEGNHLEWIVRQMSWTPPWVMDHEAVPVDRSPPGRMKRSVKRLRLGSPTVDLQPPDFADLCDVKSEPLDVDAPPDAESTIKQELAYMHEDTDSDLCVDTDTHIAHPILPPDVQPTLPPSPPPLDDDADMQSSGEHDPFQRFCRFR